MPISSQNLLRQPAVQRVGSPTSVWDWLPIALIWTTYFVFAYFVAMNDAFGLQTFDVYLNSGRALVDGEILYNGITGWIYLYPPLLAQLMMPLAVLTEYQTTTLLWFSFNIALLAFSIAQLVPYIPERWVKPLWITPIVFLPIWQAFYIGQVTIILMALLTAAWVARRKNRPGLAGTLIALAAWIKVFPGVLLLYFIWKRDWKVVVGGVVAGTILGVFQVLISGPELMIDFLNVLFSLTAEGQPHATFENLSIFAFASKLFQVNLHVEPLVVDNTLYTLTRFGLTAFIFALTAYTVLRSRVDTRRGSSAVWHFDLEYSLVILTILLLGSTLWISGLPPVLLVVILMLRNLHHYRDPAITLTAIIASVMLILLYQPSIIILFDQHNPLLLSLGFFGIMGIWITLIGLLRRHRESSY